MNYERYKRLYQRFLARSPLELIDLAGQPRGRVLDLCAGGGRLSEILVDRGYEVVAIDEDGEMMEGIDSRVTQIKFSVATALDSLQDSFADIVFCQQAVNYWFRAPTIEDLYRVMTPGGVFVFNTFNTCPGPLSSHSYSIGDNRYLEASWLGTGDLGETVVHHVQILDGEPPDTQCFKWITPDAFKSTLTPFFDVKEIRKGRTSLYRCQSRKS